MDIFLRSFCNILLKYFIHLVQQNEYSLEPTIYFFTLIKRYFIMFNKFHYYDLRNRELLQFLADVITACNQHSTEPMKLAAVFLAFSKKTAEFDKCFKIAPGSTITNELIKLDNRRDKCVKGIKSVLVGYRNHYQADKIKAASDLLACMNKYGKRIYSLNYEGETSSISSLINDWKIASCVAALTLLNLLEWSSELDISNRLFNDSYMSRVDEAASLPQVKTFESRKEAVDGFLELLKQIEARAVMSEDPIYSSLINSINVLIERYNQIGASHEEKKEEVKK